MLLKAILFAAVAPVALGLPAGQSYPTSVPPISHTKGTKTFESTEHHSWTATVTVFPAVSSSSIWTSRSGAWDVITKVPVTTEVVPNTGDPATSPTWSVVSEIPPSWTPSSKTVLTVTPLSCPDGTTSCPLLITLTDDKQPSATPTPDSCPDGTTSCPSIPSVVGRDVATSTETTHSDRWPKVTKANKLVSAPTQTILLCPNGATSCPISGPLVYDTSPSAIPTPTSCPDGSTSCKTVVDAYERDVTATAEPSVSPLTTDTFTFTLPGDTTALDTYTKTVPVETDNADDTQPSATPTPTSCPDGSTSCKPVVDAREESVAAITQPSAFTTQTLTWRVSVSGSTSYSTDTETYSYYPPDYTFDSSASPFTRTYTWVDATNGSTSYATVTETFPLTGWFTNTETNSLDQRDQSLAVKTITTAWSTLTDIVPVVTTVWVTPGAATPTPSGPLPTTTHETPPPTDHIPPTSTPKM